MTDSPILTDADHKFLEQFHNSGLGNAGRFSHREHVRLAWEAMSGRGLVEGLEMITRLISGIAQAQGDPLRYHETLTLFWGRIVHHAIQTRPELGSFDDFLAQFPLLLEKGLPLRHWSAGTLWANSARSDWAEPDLRPLSEY